MRERSPRGPGRRGNAAAVAPRATVDSSVGSSRRDDDARATPRAAPLERRAREGASRRRERLGMGARRSPPPSPLSSRGAPHRREEGRETTAVRLSGKPRDERPKKKTHRRRRISLPIDPIDRSSAAPAPPCFAIVRGLRRRRRRRRHTRRSRPRCRRARSSPTTTRFTRPRCAMTRDDVGWCWLMRDDGVESTRPRCAPSP